MVNKMIDIKGEKSNPSVVHIFNGYDNLLTALNVIKLAEKLGLDVSQRDDGVAWVTFSKDGKPVTNISFYQPSHAYAFLLGYGAAHTGD